MNTEQGIVEERAYFLSVIKTFQSYREQSLKRIQHKEKCIGSLPYHHKKWLSKYQEDLQNLKECIDKNSDFIPLVLKHAYTMFDNVYASIEITQAEQEVGTLAEGMDKVQSVFKQLMRDWSSLGAAERKQCYEPIIEEIILNYPEDKFDRGDIQVLVPGAGLGRLAFEIASRGFRCQGNEFNLFMLIVSFYVLNLCQNVDEYVIYPWIHQYCNNHSASDQMTSASTVSTFIGICANIQRKRTGNDDLAGFHSYKPFCFVCTVNVQRSDWCVIFQLFVGIMFILLVRGSYKENRVNEAIAHISRHAIKVGTVLLHLIALRTVKFCMEFRMDHKPMPIIVKLLNTSLSAESQLCVPFPDVKPMPSPKGNFSMTAGDFLEVYTTKDEWHCVATCFFIDCAPNVVQFIETIYDIVKPGGLWINLGPLLYHYSDVRNEKSIEPSFKVLCDVIQKVGFEMEKCKTGIKTKYCQNPFSMLQYEYDSVFFVCRKPTNVNINGNGKCNTDNV